MHLHLYSFLLACFLVDLVVGHTVPNIRSIHKQKNFKRDASLVDSIFQNISPRDNDFISTHITNLTSHNYTHCEQCHQKLKYGQYLLKEYPEKGHLIALLLYKYCLVSNNNNPANCDGSEFFILTTGKNTETYPELYDGGINGVTSVNFYDSDFLRMLKHFNTSSDIDTGYYCFYRGKCDVPETPDIDELYNFLQYLSPKPEFAKVAQKFEQPLERFNVLHISDFHIQDRYQLGSEANCSQYPCCLPESFNTDLLSPSYNFTDAFKKLGADVHKAFYSFYPDARIDDQGSLALGEYYDIPNERGYNSQWLPATTWGSYACDPPEIFVNSSMKFISQVGESKNFEFAIFTGDLVDHDAYHADENTTKHEEINTFNIIKHYLKQIPVYPALGNHDTFPYGQLPPIKLNYTQNYNWNAELMSNLWFKNGWINETQADYAKEHYAGFSVVTNRGLKVISINSNTYYLANLWNFVNISTDFDLFGQWQFLIDELEQSEKIGQRVWIMAHVPASGLEALPLSSAIFQRIVERFSPFTIANIFFGHTHKDQFNILYSSNGTDIKEAIQMVWISQSITPPSQNNPSWRYYEVEDKTFNIMNSYNYFSKLNSTFTNGGAEPVWEVEYSARDAYDKNHTWPLDAPINATFWDTYVASKLKDDIEVNQLYADFQYRLSPYVPDCANKTDVSEKCRNINYCDVTTFNGPDYLKCTGKHQYGYY